MLLQTVISKLKKNIIRSGILLIRAYLSEKINITLIFAMLWVWNDILKFCLKYLCMKIILSKKHEALSNNF